jgi:eukaryotic-like serine/threonine-protein kinase
MGVVFQAFDRRLGRHVAIKRLRSDLDAPSARERFRREARAAARLGHSSIVQVFDLVETDQGDWIVMELVEGPRLSDLTAAGPLPLAQVLVYGRQVADGLAVAHAAGFVHRDLKAENVMIALSGQPTAKILDFGLVWERRPVGDAEALTGTGVVMGTARSLAPEQARGLELGPRTDLFALGVLLYEMVTGRSPFQGNTAAETLHRIVAEPPAPLPLRLPPKLAALIGHLLQKAPELRPASAAEVAKRLAHLSAEFGDTAVELVPVRAEAATECSALTPSVARDTWSFGALRRNPVRLAVATTLLAVLLAGAALVRFFPDAPGQRLPAVISDAAQPFPAPVAPLLAAEAEALEKEAWAALDRFDLPGNLDRSLALFQRLIDNDLESAAAHAGLARVYWRKLDEEGGDAMWRDQALAVARRAVELNGDLAAARVSLGVILARLGQRDAARVELELAKTLDPKNADAYSGLAELHQAAEEMELAEADFRRAIELRPTDRVLHDLLGTLYFRAGRMKEAEAEYRRSTELAPDGVYGLRNLAGVLIATDRLPEAAELLKQAIQVQPNSTLYSNLGTVYFYQGLYPAAAAAYQQALGFRGGANRHDLWGNLGDSWRQIAHRRKEAPEAFRQAVRLIEPEVERNPENAQLRSQLALYLAKAGEADAARRENLRVETTEGRTLFRLAIAAELAGDRGHALDRLQQAFQHGFSITEVGREPDLLALRTDTRFQRLLTRVSR